MPVVGTAGHVDHGKSTLVKRLTGREPDRWEEERARGLTIDLGFAWADLGDDVEVSFVDVPGHDRFVKNMLAGVDGIDVAMFVVAADEGWMPQSEEHLAVLDLLDVRRGVIALTKIDRVDEDLLELATLEITEHLEGSSLEDVPIVPLSAHTGHGIDRLIEALRVQLSDVDPRSGGDARLWVDRSFSVAGAGTVVTGTLVGGPLSVGDSVMLYPSGDEARIRSLQSHEHDLEAVGPGTRVAVNLSGIDRSRISRGDMLATPGRWDVTTRFAATITPARYVEELSDKGAYHLHLGSGSWPVRLRTVSGTSATVVDIPEPVAVRIGDRFVVRDAGRRLVVGGGRVLDPDPPRFKHLTASAVSRLAESVDEPPELQAAALLSLRAVDDVARLVAHTGGEPAGALVAGGTAIDLGHAAVLTERLTTAVSRHHDDFPLRPGLGVAEAADRIGTTPSVLLELAALSDEIEVEGSVLVRSDFEVTFTDTQRTELDHAIAALRDAGTTTVPRLGELGLDRELLHAAVRRGELVQISDDFVYLPSQIDELTAGIDRFDEPFGVSEFKDAVGLSRKYAVPFLEWADDRGLTVRMGDKRRRRE